MEETKVKKLIARAKVAQQEREVWHSYWDSLARVHIPRLLGFSSTRTEGTSLEDAIFDGVPMQAARGLANAIGGLLRPEGETWARIVAQDPELNENDEAMRWLELATNRLHKALHNPSAKMRQALGETDLMLVVFGTGPLWVGENNKRSGLLFQSIPLQNAAVEWDDEGSPIGFFRTRLFNVRQAEMAFGRNNLGKRAQELINAEDFKSKLTYINIVMPRETKYTNPLLAKNLPYASYWIEQDSLHLVQESGFHEFPFVVPRMETAPGENYGRSPAMIALPDGNTLQSMGETILIAGQRAAEPPIFAPNDGSFTEANTFPGGISYYDVELASKMRGNPIFPLDTGHSLPITRDMQRDTREQVFAAFFRHVLNLPVAGPRMTATEVIERREEMIREIGPLFGRLESDYIAPLVERAFNVMLRAGAFGEIPQILAGRDIQFEYASPVKRTRQLIEREAAKMFRNEILELQQAGFEDAADHFNVDEYIRLQAETGGAPLRVLNTPETVVAKRQQRLEAQQHQQQLAESQQGVEIVDTLAGAAAKGAKAMEAENVV